MRSKKALYNIVTNFILQITSILYGFIVPRIIIDYFGSDVNGLVSSITQFLAYITLLESGFGPVVKATLYKPIAKKDSAAIAGILKTSERFFRRIALIFVLYIAVLCVVFPLFTKTNFDAVFTISLVVIISLSTLAEYFFGMAYRLFLQADQKSYVISIIQAVTYILGAIAVAVLAVIGANVLVIKLMAGLIFVSRPIIQNYYVKKKYNIKLDGEIRNYPIKQKWDGLAQHVAAVVNNNTDVAVLTVFTNFAEVSIYSVYQLVTKGIFKALEATMSSVVGGFGDMIAKNEHDTLRRRFNCLESVYLTVIAIIYSCTAILITPFVKVYTIGVEDVNYANMTFGIVLVLAGLIYAIRLPYNSLTLAAGHFRETRKGAWVEAIINIVISIALVWKIGLVGVAIGTLVAQLIRTSEFIYHLNKWIIGRKLSISVKKVTLLFAEVFVVIAIGNMIIDFRSVSIMNWLLLGLCSLAIVGAFVLVVNLVFYRREFNEFKRIFLRRKNGK